MSKALKFLIDLHNGIEGSFGKLTEAIAELKENDSCNGCKFEGETQC